MKPKCITIVSGGMDSVTLAYLIAETYNQHIISFDYGQRHRRELVCAAMVANDLECEHTIIPLKIGELLKGSSLTDSSVVVPEGHYAEETMKQTIVPNRNAIMLSIAWGIAIAEKAEIVAYGAHSGDHDIYPDCRKDFIKALKDALLLGSAWETLPKAIFTPFIDLDKAGILLHGMQLNVPYQNTWTCYKGGNVACGKCGACCERLTAFHAIGREDPLEYVDREYWKQAVANYQNK